MSRESIPGEFYDALLHGVTATVGHVQLHVVIDLVRPVQREAVVRAVEGTVAAFPVLGSRYETAWWRDRWVVEPGISAEDVVEVLEGDPEELLRELPQRPLDPARDWPWRVSMMDSRLVVTVLHGVADGAGALTVAGEFAARLAGREGSAADGAMDRGFVQLLRSLRLVDLPYLLIGCVQQGLQALRVPFLTKTQLRAADPAPVEPKPVYRTVAVGVGEGSDVREVCGRVGCTVNDALVGALAVVCASLGPKGLLGSYFTVDLRRYLVDKGPKVTNLSGVDSVILRREMAGSLEDAAGAVGRRTERMKRQLLGVGFAALPAIPLMVVPHGIVRGFAALWARWAGALLTRGLVVTNVGPMDRYLEPLGEDVVAASVLGPFGIGPRVPIITATGFRDRLTLQINGYDTIDATELDRLAGRLGEVLGGGASDEPGDEGETT
jgi:NRPS condensation-like uncharacterized protein